MSKVKVLFVCMGNICRSPTAHGVMHDKVLKRGLQSQIEVDSAGTHAYHEGEMSDPRSRAMAEQRGIDMDFIRARKISIVDYDQFDYILAMDQDNLDLIEHYAPDKHFAKIALFLDFALASGSTDQEVVPDPYYGGGSGFEMVYDLVDKGCDALIENILHA
ncbi:MAG: protein-tyrosine phosphatase [Cryomorphaceae bacterium]|jgi:protein-tyrosine phosphatase